MVYSVRSYQDAVLQFAEGSIYQYLPAFWRQYWLIVMCSVLLYLTGGLTIYLALNRNQRVATPRQRAHILSSISSSVCTLMALPLASIASYRMMMTFGGKEQREQDLMQWMFSSSLLSEWLLVIYLVFLHLDLIGGIMVYSEFMELISGWGHHFVFILVINNALYHRWGNGLANFFIEELPTAILSIGSLTPSLRHDLAFGITFAITRLLYHTVASIIIASVMWTPLIILGFLSLGLHIWWFSRWCRGMERYGRIEEPGYDLVGGGSETDTGHDEDKIHETSIGNSGRLRTLTDVGLLERDTEDEPLS